VDNKIKLVNILNAIKKIQKEIKVVFPVHPRTIKMIKKFKLITFLKNMDNLILSEPLGYLDFSKLMACSKLILTDSGGIQEETTILNIPCLTLRENTERPVTVSRGTNTIVGSCQDKILIETNKILSNNYRIKAKRRPEFWDGKASSRIVKVLLKTFAM
tara:strand:- start:5 stop:481 length:477 start_codon:yes stop_codon:yes gene_type:complete